MKVRKVTDPAKKVTDTVLLAELARRGINKDYVEFAADYGKRVKGKSSPYAKFYRDLKSNKRFAVFSQLPMVNTNGRKVKVGWSNLGNNKYKSKNNLFSAVVDNASVTIIIKNDQPDGRKKNDSVSFAPALYFNSVEVAPVSDPVLLSVDPVNSGYTENTIEWDYGVCKRRLRLVEGRILGSWVFESNPHGAIRIKYNQSGDFKLRLGRFKTDDDEELIPASFFDSLSPAGMDNYPFSVSDSDTFYPDANPESTSVDGFAGEDTKQSFASLVADAGGMSNDSIEGYYICSLVADTVSNIWWNMFRGIFLFDTSGLPDGASITGATLSIYGYAKSDSAGWLPDINIYSSNPASNTALANGDYDSLGTIAFATAIGYNDWNTSGYNDFTFNSDGLNAISKTGVSKFGTRNANYEVAGSPPTWANGQYYTMMGYFAEKGSGYKPKLVITYTEGETKTSSDSGGGVDSTCYRELGIAEAGDGIEQSLNTAAVAATDAGSGWEIGGLLKSLFSQDEGSGVDNIGILTNKTGHDLRLHSTQGRVSIPHKEVGL